MNCTECHYRIRLIRAPMPPKDRKLPRMTKKERLRARWAGRTDQRFSRIDIPKGGGKGGA
jgi:hypothetical protein